MALIEMGGRRFTIPVGELYLGSDAACAIPVSGPGVYPRHARLDGLPDGQVAIRKVDPAADVLINGVRLGAEPTPLLHGDKIEVAGQELTFVDERRSGSTQYVQALSVEQAAEVARTDAGAPTGSTGGRLVCLTDGREYLVAGAALVFGREAGSDVVVPGKDVSRRHAEILQTPKGYLLIDSSTNGTFVNEERVVGQRLLARADVIRIGDEQFRFYADPPVAAAAPEPAPGVRAGAGERLKDTMHGVSVPSAVEARTAAPLAALQVREGALKGQRLAVRAPVVNLGRAEYNDLVLPDPSVSTAHAKLQRREGVWVLVDLESTNGSFVDGERVRDEAPLAPGATIRLGDVVLVFEPPDDERAVAKGGGTRVMQPIDPTAPAPPPAPPSPPRAAPPASPAAPARSKPRAPRPAPPPATAKGCGSGAGVLLLAAVGVAYWLLP